MPWTGSYITIVTVNQHYWTGNCSSIGAMDWQLCDQSCHGLATSGGLYVITGVDC